MQTTAMVSFLLFSISGQPRCSALLHVRLPLRPLPALDRVRPFYHHVHTFLRPFPRMPKGMSCLYSTSSASLQAPTLNSDKSSEEAPLPAPPKRKESAEHFAYWFTTYAFLMPEIRPVTFLSMVFSAVVALAYKHGVIGALDLQPHSLLAGPLGFLLTFRAQQGFDRCQGARRTWDTVLDTSRDMARCVGGADILLSDDKYSFPAGRLIALIQAYGILLEEFVTRIPREDELKELLSEQDLLVLEARRTHRPVALIEIMAQEVARIARAQTTFRESPYFSRLLNCIDQLGHHTTLIHSLTKTPVPPIFYTHALRFLTLYVFTLPLALVDKIPGGALVPVIGLMTWILFGLRELGIKAQYPFSTGLVNVKTVWEEVVFNTPDLLKDAVQKVKKQM
ncbi:bestrophin-like protein [Nannochloropsis gaditana]|uniref:Bestrophin-like protein n=1 Tax=Nannochloropsis gaditana TaxID=72520 RepID=W7TQ44_9STRA|nr:bestrophin-like protein [Nannochloropsis gaditana]